MARVKFQKTHPGVKLPFRQSAGSAGYDVTAFLDEEVKIARGEIIAIPTGLKVELPPEYMLSVRPRSGLALKHGITCINSPGTIDSDFRGEIKILLINAGPEDYVIHPGERIAQFILEPVLSIEWEESDLSETSRGEGGFGSTGRT